MDSIQKTIDTALMPVIRALNHEDNKIRDRMTLLEGNIVSDMEMIRDNIETIEDTMKTLKQEIYHEVMPIINGLIVENTKLQDQVQMLTENVMMFRDKLRVSEDEPYNTAYDYEDMKAKRIHLHAEFKNIYRFFKKSLKLTYDPIPIAVVFPNKLE